MASVDETAFEKQLLRDGVLDEAQLDQARAAAAASGERLIDAVVANDLAPTEAVYRSLARFCDKRYVVLSELDIPESVVSRVPARLATHYGFVPVQERNGVLVVAVSDPLNAQLLDGIRLHLKLKKRVEPVVATPEEIRRAIKALFGVGAETVERILSDTGSVASVVSLDSVDAGSDLGDDNIDASIVKFVNELLAEAIQAGATDIHIEPFEQELRVRYRIDGILHQVPTPGSIRGFQPAIVSRIKIMANLNIAEKRLPQDGKFRASLGDLHFDLRVSILPTPYGETVNMRLLNRSSMFLTLEELGFLPGDLGQFERFIQRPHGMILLTGPTGSGKTTTLYAALSKLNSLDRKVITIEDPIEYQLQGITQMQVLGQIGFTFSIALRHMLRHDPDIMLVGEIRDFETAEMAIRSSLTGHLVFSTLHTNDAAGAVTRLTDMGVDSYLVASTTIATIAQRLVRCICPDCAEDFEPDAELLERLQVASEIPKDARFRAGRGCNACRNTGYRGRVAIYEILPFSGTVKEMTVQGAPVTDIKRQACKEGMKTLREAGWARICQGRTTFDEVLRVTADADLMDVHGAGDAAVSV